MSAFDSWRKWGALDRQPRREDVLQWASPDDALIFDVGWFEPEFVCQVVRHRDWENALETARFTEIADVERWLDEMTNKYVAEEN